MSKWMDLIEQAAAIVAGLFLAFVGASLVFGVVVLIVEHL